jgi:hypothetical protein
MKPGDLAKKLIIKCEVIINTLQNSLNRELIHEQYEKQLNELIDKTLDFAYEQGYKNGNDDKEKKNNNVTPKNFDEYHSVSEQNQYSRMKSNVVISHRIHSTRHYTFKNAYDEILRIDLKEKQRYLFFRILTAIGIAGVVLGTAWVANRYGIPLPLSGIRQVAASAG